ncbi:hypothetical protein C2E23DRAFT_859557 [Lenzites betulinus]|nr:hypothetical protein C2E23DRAFT_859557 [Lenzites betulinus]
MPATTRSVSAVRATPTRPPADVHESPRTYAQVLASPPTSPKERAAAPPPSNALELDTGLGKTSKHASTKETLVGATPSTGARLQSSVTRHEQRNRSTDDTCPTTPGPSAPASLAQHGPSTLTDASPMPSEYQFDDIDMLAFEQSCIEENRRYGTPTSKDWRNLSVHGNESVASDDAAGIICDTVVRDEVDIENFVTDGMDRFGEVIPGQEKACEEARARKRQRISASPPRTEARKTITVRFRKHRDKATNVRGDDRGQPANTSADPSAAEPPPFAAEPLSLQDTWLRSTIPKQDLPRLSKATKGKAVARPTGQSGREEEVAPERSGHGVPWSALAVDMDVDDEAQMRHPLQEPISAHPEGLIEDLALSRIDEAWKQPEGTVLFVQVANVGYPDAHLRKPIHDEIHALIQHVTGETAFVPVAPQPEWVPPPRRAGAPITWTILGLKQQHVRDLVRLKVLSSVWITLFFYERKLVIPRYLFTLTGYTTNHEDDIVHSVKGAFLDDPIFSRLADLTQSHPMLQYLAPHEAAAQIASSVEVRIDHLGNGNMQAAVFCDPPTGCGETWKIWRAELMKMPFHSRYNPTATARRIEVCACCHSADHLTHKCPFLHIQGWNAPPPTTRTYGRQRPQAAPGHAAPYRPPTPMNARPFRGRGRGTGPLRGMREGTPTRNQHTPGFGM